MAETLTHRELRNRSGEVLRAVAGGATYEITNHGKVVAVLSPPASGTDLRVRPAKIHGRFSELRPVRRDRPVQESLGDLRGDR